MVLQLFGFAMGWSLTAPVLFATFTEFSFDWLGSLALNPLAYAIVEPLSATIGERQAMGYAATLLAMASFGPLAVPAVVGLRLPSFEAAALPEEERS